MSAFKDKVQASAKAFFGGLAGFLISMLFTTMTDPNSAINPDAPHGASAIIQLPNTSAEWWALVISVVTGFILPWVKKNYPSIAVAEQQLAEAQSRVQEGKQQA